MKSIANQYKDLKEGKMSQANFMRNLRMSMPQFVTNVTSFNDAIRILKNKAILVENLDPSEDEEIEDMIAKAEEEESGKHTKFQDVPGTISEEHDFPRDAEDMADLVVNKYGKELAQLSGVQREKWALNHAFKTILNSGHPDARVIARNLNSDEDWSMDFVSAVNDKLRKKDMPGFEGTWDSLDKLSIKEARKKKEAKAELHPNQIHPQELRMGIKVEMEHTDDPKKAEKIALDHLAENPFYYTALKLSGIESPSAPKAKPVKEKKTKKRKEAIQLVDLVNGMKKVKEEKKKLKEARLNIDGEPNEVVKQAMEYVSGPNANPTLKAISDKIEFQQSNDPNEAILRYDYWDVLPNEAVGKLELQFNVEHETEPQEDQLPIHFYRLTPKHKKAEKYRAFQSKLEELVKEVMAEYYFDGRDNLADEIAAQQK